MSKFKPKYSVESQQQFIDHLRVTIGLDPMYCESRARKGKWREQNPKKRFLTEKIRVK